jgi:hypothetical protein
MKEICAFCKKGDERWRDPKLYPLRKITDNLHREESIYAHVQCIIFASWDYEKTEQIKSLLKDWLGMSLR